MPTPHPKTLATWVARGTALTIVGALVLLLSGTAVAQGIVARIQADLVNGGGGARASPDL